MLVNITYLKCFIFCFVFSLSATAQIAVLNEKELPSIKNGTTYIVMNDPQSKETENIRIIFKEYWTYNDVQFINSGDIDSHLEPDNAFISFSAYTTDVTTGSGMSYSNTHIYLQLWKPESKFFKKKQRKEKNGKEINKIGDLVKLARIELYPNYEYLTDIDSFLTNGYKNSESIYNWGPGILKNYIQSLMILFAKDEERELYESMSNKNELAKLKQEPLYIPNYIFGDAELEEGISSNDQFKLLEEYEHDYKVLSTEELNNKIISDESLLYYFVYVQSSTDKFTSVVNSRTGDIIYSEYTPISYGLKQKDFKKISKDID